MVDSLASQHHLASPWDVARVSDRWTVGVASLPDPYPLVILPLAGWVKAENDLLYFMTRGKELLLSPTIATSREVMGQGCGPLCREGRVFISISDATEVG